MLNDVEVIEATSECELQDQIKSYLQENAIAAYTVSYAAYEDYETKELIYSASIFFS